MGFSETILTLQRAPRRKREIVLAISVAVIMLIIIGIWLWQLPKTLAPSPTRNTLERTLGPIELLWNMVREGISEIGNK